MIYIAVCDDNQFQLNIAKTMIDDTLTIKNIDHSIVCFFQANALMQHLDSISGIIDIIFLDIKLQNETGIEIAKVIKITYPHIKVIFMTAHISYARDIFDAAPTYFLLKPMSQYKLEAALASAIESVSKLNNAIISVFQKGQLYNLRISLIDYAMSSGRVLTFFEEGKKIEAYAKMDDIEQKLGPQFLRCHQSYVVNMERIRSFDKLSIVLYSGVTVPVSKNRHTQAKAAFLKYLGGSL